MVAWFNLEAFFSGGGTAPAFKPDDITGLRVWFDASKLLLADGAQVTSWPNLGSGGAPTIIDSVPLVTFKTNALNTKPVVRFGANGSRLRMTGIGVTRDFTLAYVARMWGPNGGRVVTADYPNGGNFLFGYWTTYMDVAYCGGGGGFFVPDTKVTTNTQWRLYSADGASAAYLPRFFADGVFMGQHPDVPIDSWGNTFHLSGYSAATLEETCDCDVAEVILYNKKLSDGERVQVEGYLRDKWMTAPPVTGPASTLLVSYTPGTDRNDFTGEVGVRLGIGPASIPITWVGARRHSSAQTGIHIVKLYEWFSDTVVCSANIDYTGVAVGAYAWTAVAPVTLLANGYYALLMAVTASDGQMWCNPGATTFQPSITNVYDCYRVPASALATGGINTQFIGLDLGS